MGIRSFESTDTEAYNDSVITNNDNNNDDDSKTAKEHTGN